MAPLSEHRIAKLLQPYVDGLALPPSLYVRVSAYLELLIRWNSRTNLTSVRDPELLVQRQVGESLFAAHLLECSGSLLDFGSGAGFPGIPLQLACPELSVTLTESQGKKASFLREAVRVLGLGCKVFAGRVEDIPADEQFGVVTMRAVDQSSRMLTVAAERVAAGGSLVLYTAERHKVLLEGWDVVDDRAIPGTAGRLLHLQRA